MSEKVASKLGLSIRKSNKKIKTVNFMEGLTMGVARGMELQIRGWKGKEDFEVIQLDDYDFVLGLNFIYRIKVDIFPLLIAFISMMIYNHHVLCLVNRDMKAKTKVLSAIQLVKDVSYGKNIELVD
ncbi:hypothetical protein J1N35_037376 [Gossypium stocksii]|uniref:Uncharacterized protein n=1 Tax=Gossypium stocksii TaxID=47602 RepID=A0A9D3ZLQ3_9ROSI|nr:hypothetical protein J1N35_037376 [Gossypium stocksii]